MLSRFAQSQRYFAPAAATRTIAMSPRLLHTQGAISFVKQKIPYEDDPNEPTTNAKQSGGNAFFENLIYGNKVLRAIDGETHSKILARGKYVHELQSKFILLYHMHGNQGYNSSCSPQSEAWQD